MLAAGESAVSAIVDLVLETVPRSAVLSIVNHSLSPPALLSGDCSSRFDLRWWSAKGRGRKTTVAPVGLKAEIKKLPCLIGVESPDRCGRRYFVRHRGMSNDAGIGSITPAALAKVGGNVIKLPPGDCHFVAVCRVN